MEKNPRSVGVHDGPFHADEVTACALLLLYGLIDKEKIVRTRDIQKLKACEYVCDVGGVYDAKAKLFDHHQADYSGDLSSAGMVWAYLKSQNVVKHREWTFFNSMLVKGVDDHDNGKSPQILGLCSFSHVIANFNPVSYEATDSELTEAFFEALEFAYGHISRLRARHRYNEQCQGVVQKTMEKYKTCLLFDRAIPWQESFFALDGEHHSALFVIMPAGTNWKLRGIPPTMSKRMQVRLPLPEKWAGLLEEGLKKVTGIEGAIFCHRGRFTSVWQTKEDALKALEIVLKENGVKSHDNPL